MSDPSSSPIRDGDGIESKTHSQLNESIPDGQGEVPANIEHSVSSSKAIKQKDLDDLLNSLLASGPEAIPSSAPATTPSPAHDSVATRTGRPRPSATRKRFAQFALRRDLDDIRDLVNTVQKRIDGKELYDDWPLTVSCHQKPVESDQPNDPWPLPTPTWQKTMQDDLQNLSQRLCDINVGDLQNALANLQTRAMRASIAQSTSGEDTNTPQPMPREMEMLPLSSFAHPMSSSSASDTRPRLTRSDLILPRPQPLPLTHIAHTVRTTVAALQHHPVPTAAQVATGFKPYRAFDLALRNTIDGGLTAMTRLHDDSGPHSRGYVTRWKVEGPLRAEDRDLSSLGFVLNQALEGYLGSVGVGTTSHTATESNPNGEQTTHNAPNSKKETQWWPGPSHCEQPFPNLPEGWKVCTATDGREYIIDSNRMMVAFLDAPTPVVTEGEDKGSDGLGPLPDGWSKAYFTCPRREFFQHDASGVNTKTDPRSTLVKLGPRLSEPVKDEKEDEVKIGTTEKQAQREETAAAADMGAVAETESTTMEEGKMTPSTSTTSTRPKEKKEERMLASEENNNDDSIPRRVTTTVTMPQEYEPTVASDGQVSYSPPTHPHPLPSNWSTTMDPCNQATRRFYRMKDRNGLHAPNPSATTTAPATAAAAAAAATASSSSPFTYPDPSPSLSGEWVVVGGEERFVHGSVLRMRGLRDEMGREDDDKKEDETNEDDKTEDIEAKDDKNNDKNEDN